MTPKHAIVARANFRRVGMRAVLRVPKMHTRDDAVGSREPRREVDVLAVHPGEPHPEDGVQPVVHRPWGGGRSGCELADSTTLMKVLNSVLRRGVWSCVPPFSMVIWAPRTDPVLDRNDNDNGLPSSLPVPAPTESEIQRETLVDTYS